jgi:hypothetical protein
MRVSFLYRASGLFITSICKRDNYKRELKKGNEENSMQSILERLPRESLRPNSGRTGWHAMERPRHHHINWCKVMMLYFLGN